MCRHNPTVVSEDGEERIVHPAPTRGMWRLDIRRRNPIPPGDRDGTFTYLTLVFETEEAMHRYVRSKLYGQPVFILGVTDPEGVYEARQTCSPRHWRDLRVWPVKKAATPEPPEGAWWNTGPVGTFLTTACRCPACMRNDAMREQHPEHHPDTYYEYLLRVVTNHPDTARRVMLYRVQATAEAFNNYPRRAEIEDTSRAYLRDAIIEEATAMNLPGLRPTYVRSAWFFVEDEAEGMVPGSEFYEDSL